MGGTIPRLPPETLDRKRALCRFDFAGSLPRLRVATRWVSSYRNLIIVENLCGPCEFRPLFHTDAKEGPCGSLDSAGRRSPSAVAKAHRGRPGHPTGASPPAWLEGSVGPHDFARTCRSVVAEWKASD